MRPIGYPDISVRITTARCVIAQKSAVLNFAAEARNHASDNNMANAPTFETKATLATLHLDS